MPLKIIRNDIVKMKVDAIVNPTGRYFDGTGGADRAIHRAAGEELYKECKSLGELGIGQAKITKGYRLDCKYIIHTRGPIWKDGRGGEDKLLSSSYKNSLKLALDYNLKSIAFPLIAAGSFGYPKDRALRTAISTLGDFLLENEMMIYLVVYDKSTFKLSERLFSSIKEYIDDRYVDKNRRLREELYTSRERILENISLHEETAPAKKHGRSLRDVINNRDESFSQMLLRLIDQQGKTDVEVYKKANIDRRLFSKIRNNVNYKPSKTTAIAFAIALELNLDETQDLILRAGYGLSPSNKFDLIIEYFIEKENYNIFEINEALFAFDEKPIGV